MPFFIDSNKMNPTPYLILFFTFLRKVDLRMSFLRKVDLHISFLRLSLLCLPFIFHHSATASISRSAGLGSQSSALGGVSVTGHQDGFAAAHNPATLSGGPGNNLRISWGVLWQDPQFKPISSVVVANAYTSDTFRRADVDTDYPTTFAQVLGISVGLTEDASKWWGLSLGLTAVMPLDTIAEIDTGENFVPEYTLYRSGAKKPEFLFGLGVHPTPWLRVGAGLQTGLAVDAETNLFLQNSVDRPSTIRLKARTKPKMAPYFGILVSQNDDWKIGSNFRLPLKSPLKLYLTPSARVFGSSAAGLDFNITAESVLFYEPMTAELGGSIKHPLFSSATKTIRGEFFGQVNYEVWRPFEPSSIRITNTSTSRCEDPSYCGISFSNGRAADMRLKNIFVFQVGESVGWTDNDTMRLGYTYRPGIIENGSENKAVGNAIDPDSHRFSIGYGRRFKKVFGSSQPLSFDLHASYQKLVQRKVEKSAGIENNLSGITNSQNEKIGSPGYTVGGYILGAGASFSLAF